MGSGSLTLKRKRENQITDDRDGDDDPLIVKSTKKKPKKRNVAEPKRKISVEVVKDEAEAEVVRSNPDMVIRRYQLEILHVAIEKNTVVFLETGCGKTLIAVLLMKRIAHKLRDQGGKGIIVFLAPTIQLVMQQSEVIKINTDLKVACYHGSKGIDGWNVERWKREIDLNEVLVMTPQILLDGLRLSFIKLDLVDLLIFDECHHTWGQHPYAKIMKEYYNKSQHRPKIFGMTASPVIRKGVSSNNDCADQIARLENILDSKVYTLKDRIELDLFVPTPNQIIKYYQEHSSLHESMQQKLVALRDKDLQSHFCHYQFKDEEEFMKKARKKIRIIHGNIEYCLKKLGLFCAYKAVQIFLSKDKTEKIWEVDSTVLNKVQESTDAFLKGALEILEHALPTGAEKLISSGGSLDAVKVGLFTPKVYLLMQLILQQRNAEDMRCIIFVERVVVAAVIASLIQQVDCLSFAMSDYLASATSVLGRKKQQRTLELFCNGKVNVLVATDVVEEGIDVQSCSCVIRFDLPKTVRSFIQSRGRARQSKSQFILLVERGNEKHRKLLLEIMMSEESMKEMALNRNHTPYIREQFTVEADAYHVLSTGATVNCDSSISFIYKYCAKLPGDNYYTPRPEFMPRKVEGEDNLYKCILKLPPNAPFQEVISPPNGKLLCAKQLACLEACKRLHEVGALDDYLQPVTEVMPEEEEIMNMQGKRTSGPGTTKRKELHSTSKVYDLSGSWGEELTGVTLQVYKLVFTSQSKDDVVYANFALLIEAILDDDVANAEIDLLLTAGKVVKSKLLHCGELHLDSSQLKDAKDFQEMLCNGIFGKLMHRCKKPEGSNYNIMIENILETTESKRLWDSSNMYIILPLESDKIEVSQGDINVDWKCISSCAAGARLFKFLSISEKENIRDRLQEILLDCTTRFHCRSGDTETINLANGVAKASDLIDKAVVGFHNGKIYCVTEILHDKTAESPFPKSEGSRADNYFSYYEYFEKKYGKKLKHVNQPLLRVKQSHRPHNLLAHHLEKSKGRGSNIKVGETNYVELPPELCVELGVTSSVIRTMYLIPSVMHRLNALMLATQLRRVIKEEHPKCPLVPAALIMEALTSLRCLERFSYERLELLGDSFLKYAISRHLFLKYEKKHEGQLSARRAWGICNATLHRLAMIRNLPGYIRDEPFDPLRWVAPGMLCRKSIACRCNLRHLEDTVKNSNEKEDKVVKIGKACDEGHRWLCSKTISDVVEALIGAYLVGGGSIAALEFMKWLNMEVDFELDLVEAAFQRAFVYPCVLRSTNLHGLESLLGYTFRNKGLLVEAITHASQQDPEGGCCYQRLEFLGDSVLDVLITRHLFSTYPGLSPGVLTDLRSAAVNNENFAWVAVKKGIQKYLRHGSGALLSQITEFVKAVGQSKEGECRFIAFGGGIGGPKVLGDLIESIAGAILVDTRFDLERVWEVMKPILSPIVTPETLNLHPLRELQELCCQSGYCIRWKFSKEGKLSVVSAEVQLEDSIIVGTGCKMNKKTAKKEAAEQLLSRMEEKGFYHNRRQYLQNSTNLIGEVVPDTIVIHLGHNGMVSVSEADDSDKLNGKFVEESLVANSEENISKLELLTASSACLETCNTEKSDMVVSKDQCCKGTADQEGCSLHSCRLILGDMEVVHSLRHFGCTAEKDYKPLKRELRLDESITDKAKAGRCWVQQGGDLSPDTGRKRPKLLETSVNSRTSEEVSTGEKDITWAHKLKDISHQNWSPEGGLTSMSKVEEESNHLEARYSSVLDNELVSAKKAYVQSGTPPVLIPKRMGKGVPRAALHELCSKSKWPEPVFDMVSEGGLPHTRSFVYTVHIPLRDHEKIRGHSKTDKKSARDSAAMLLLRELEKQGLCVIDELMSVGLGPNEMIEDLMATC